MCKSHGAYVLLLLSLNLQLFSKSRTASSSSIANMASAHSIKPKERRKRRKVSLYDAVAGRAGYEGFLSEQQPSKYGDTASTSKTAVPPEEVLFRRKGALVRYEEDDIYTADRNLQLSQKLPDSDLLKALHLYASDFYSRETGINDKTSFRSLDEAALLAMGILLEEAAQEAIDGMSDLSFTDLMNERPRDGTVANDARPKS